MSITRRRFLELSAAGAAVASATSARAEVPSPSGEIAVWTTAGADRHASRPALAWSRGAGDAPNVVRIDPSRERQPVLGFGAAFTDAACFTFNRLEPGVRKKLFADLFGPSRLGLSVHRVAMGASDYATTEYSYCEGLEPDPEMRRFSIAHDRQWILPMLREARAVNPEMHLLASPWSPPAWMKPNKSMRGGSMRPSSLAPYALYFEKFLNAYAAEGVPVHAVTPQNEIDTDQDGRMPACCWPQEVEIAFVRDHLGPRLAASKHPADIWLLDHNYNLWGRVVCELEDPGVRRYAKGVAWHGYAGRPEQMLHVSEAFPDVGMFWTEGGPNWEKGDYYNEWSRWGDTITGVLRNEVRAIIGWNYALDEKGDPNIGPFKCAGLVTVDSKTRQVSYSAQYWALWHFSAHIRRNARIVHSTGEAPVSHVAARNPDGGLVVVLTNRATQPATVTVALGDASVSTELPADSITTLAWPGQSVSS
jgi:glucosylceramidase